SSSEMCLEHGMRWSQVSRLPPHKFQLASCWGICTFSSRTWMLPKISSRRCCFPSPKMPKQKRELRGSMPRENRSDVVSSAHEAGHRQLLGSPFIIFDSAHGRIPTRENKLCSTF